MNISLPNKKILALVFSLFAGCASAELDDRNQLMVLAVKEGNPGMVQRAIEMGADAKIKGAEKNSLLHLAVRPNQQEFEKVLFRNNDSIETGELNAGSVMCKEHVKNRVEVLKMLIRYGIPVNAKNSRNETPLYSAVANLPCGSADVPSVPPVDGRISSSFGWRTVRVNGESDYHRAIDIAATNGTVIRATAKGTVKATGINDQLGNFIVLDHGNGYETVYGHCHIINISRGSVVKRSDTIGYVGETGNASGNHCHYEVRLNGSPVDPLPYLLAGIYGTVSRRCAIKFAELLIKNGADINAKNSYGRTPLHEAPARDPELAMFLIEHGGNPDIQDNNGITPIHEASAINGDLVKYLISRNADINRRSVHAAAIDGRVYPAGTTPLGVALLSGKTEIALLLASRGAVK